MGKFAPSESLSIIHQLWTMLPTMWKTTTYIVRINYQWSTFEGFLHSLYLYILFDIITLVLVVMCAKGLQWEDLLFTVHHHWVFNTVQLYISFRLDNATITLMLATLVVTAVLLIRRFTTGGELGGSTASRLFTAGFLTLLWLIYIFVNIALTYEVIVFDFFGMIFCDFWSG